MNPKSTTPKIPRPKNAFILFRQHYHRILIDEWTAQGVEIPHNSNISKIIGTKWKGLQPEDKAHWENLAKKEKLEHERKYPEYKYKPIRKSKKKQLLLKEVEEQQQQQQQQQTQQAQTQTQTQTQPQPQLQQPFNNNIVLMKRAHSLSPSSSVSSSNSYQFQLNNDFRRLPIPSVSSPNYMVSRPLNGLPLTHEKAARDLPQLSSQFHSVPHYSAPHDSATRHHYLNIAQAQPRANSTPQLPLISSIINNSNQTPVTSTTTTTTTATSSPSKLSSSPSSSIFENNRLNSINSSNQYLPPPLLPSLQDFQLDQYQQLKQMGPTYIVKPLSHARNNLLSTATPTHHHIPHIPNQNIPLHQIINSNNEVTAKTSLVSPK